MLTQSSILNLSRYVVPTRRGAAFKRETASAVSRLKVARVRELSFCAPSCGWRAKTKLAFASYFHAQNGRGRFARESCAARHRQARFIIGGQVLHILKLFFLQYFLSKNSLSISEREFSSGCLIIFCSNRLRLLPSCSLPRKGEWITSS